MSVRRPGVPAAPGAQAGLRRLEAKKCLGPPLGRWQMCCPSVRVRPLKAGEPREMDMGTGWNVFNSSLSFSFNGNSAVKSTSLLLQSRH